MHISSRCEGSLAQAYTTFVAKADHRAVVADLAPPVCVHGTPHWKCPLGFLQSTIVVDTIKQKLSDIDAFMSCPLAEWSVAKKIIQRVGTKNHKATTVKLPTTSLALLFS